MTKESAVALVLGITLALIYIFGCIVNGGRLPLF